MDWFNYYGLAIMAVIMIPNIIYAVKHKNQVVVYGNKAAIIFEQIGRYGCFAFMIFNIPYTYIGFWFSFGKIFYITVNAVLLLGYCISWSVLRNKKRYRKSSVAFHNTVIGFYCIKYTYCKYFFYLYLPLFLP